MRGERRDLGVTIGHDAQPAMPAHAFHLSTGHGIGITIWTYGAALVEVFVPDRDGKVENVVARLPDLRSYENKASNPSYMGAVMGRYARCIAGGAFSLDNVRYQLDRNIGEHHFHGGSVGFDRFVWASDMDISADGAALHLYLERPDGDQGYPGAIAVQSTYLLRPNGDLVISHRATASRSTIVGLCGHAYWNLAGAGRIDGHHLSVNAQHVIETDAALIPTGRLPAVEGTDLDWTRARQIGWQRLDHCFRLADASWAARLSDRRSGRTMDVLTDQPGLAIYSADMLERPRSGLCLQSTALPDSPNRPEFPSSRLDPGQLYQHRTIHRFSLDPKR